MMSRWAVVHLNALTFRETRLRLKSPMANEHWNDGKAGGLTSLITEPSDDSGFHRVCDSSEITGYQLWREKNGIVSGGLREVVLLTVRSYEMIESEFHERNMEQVSRTDQFSQTVVFGDVGGNIENFVIINFKEAERPDAQMLLKQGLSGLLLCAGQQRLARRIFQQCLAVGDVENLDFIKTGEKRGRLVVLQQGVSCL